MATEALVAAEVCLTPDYVPKRRPRRAFEDAELTRDALDEIVRAGLMVRVGTDLDPRFGFVLDPVAEYLGAKRMVISARGDADAWARLATLAEELARDADAAEAGFASALAACFAMEAAPGGA